MMSAINVPLFPLFADYWDKPLSELPEALKASVGSDFHHWDKLELHQRKSFIEQLDYKRGYNKEEVECGFAETVYNGELIDWQIWLAMRNITPEQAAKLVFCIDPIKWKGDNYAEKKIPDDLQAKIDYCAQFLAGLNQEWTLSGIVQAIGADGVPYSMKQAVDNAPPAAPVEQAAPVATVKQEAPIPIIRQRCNAILSWLKSEKYDPQNLPAPLKNGLATVKATCRAALCQNKKMFSSIGVFEKAWQQLRADGEINGLK